MKGTNSIKCTIDLISSHQLEPIPSKPTLCTCMTPIISVLGEGGPVQEDTSQSDIHAGLDQCWEQPFSCCQQLLAL